MVGDKDQRGTPQAPVQLRLIIEQPDQFVQQTLPAMQRRSPGSLTSLHRTYASASQAPGSDFHRMISRRLSRGSSGEVGRDFICGM